MKFLSHRYGTELGTDFRQDQGYGQRYRRDDESAAIVCREYDLPVNRYRQCFDGNQNRRPADRGWGQGHRGNCLRRPRGIRSGRPLPCHRLTSYPTSKVDSVAETHDTTDQHPTKGWAPWSSPVQPAGWVERLRCFARQGYPVAAVDIDPDGIKKPYKWSPMPMVQLLGSLPRHRCHINKRDGRTGQRLRTIAGTTVRTVNAAIYATINRSSLKT